MQAQIVQEKQVTIDDVIKEANTVDGKCRDLRRVNTPPDKILDMMHLEHRQFGQAYPLVMRYICELALYSAKAFKRYLRWIQHHPWKSEDEFLDAQARYVRVLHEVLQPHTPVNKLNEIYENARRLLHKEYKDLKELTIKMDKEVKEEEADIAIRARDQFTEFCKMHGQILTDIPIVCQSDLPADNLPDVEHLFC